MRLSKHLYGMLLVLSLNCTHLPAQKGNSAKVESPWELRLSVTGGVKLRVVLHNRTRVPRTYLYDSTLQPVELLLATESRNGIEPLDTRANAKFDNTIYREMYRQLAPESDVTLIEAAIDRDHTLRWGPFLFTGLTPGVYQAHAVWHSETNEFYERESKRTRTLKDVWLGEVMSDSAIVKVP